VLRAIPVNAPAARVAAQLRQYRFQPSAGIAGGGAVVTVGAEEPLSIALSSGEGDARTLAVFFVQPVDAGRSVIRGVLDGEPADGDRISILRHHNERLSALRDMVERQASAEPAPAPIEPVYERVSAELAAMPELQSHGRKAALRVEVARKWQAAQGIAGFELKPVEGLLPTFQPGAHIDVHMPNGRIRQYSIANGPGESGSYVIGVKREPDSKGGSICMHDTVREGDVLAISEPRNNFPLRRDATRTLLVAGGIGITPLLAMAQALLHSGLPHELHYFAQAGDHLAFPERLDLLKDTLVPHLGLAPHETAEALAALLSSYRAGMHLYLCGPGPMLEAARRIAAAQGWPIEAVHFEYFKNTTIIDDSSSFEVALARSSLTLAVPAGRTILEVLREADIDLPSSCEQGACGTCVVTVLEGVPDHQDVYLDDAEKQSGTKIMTCVSRARSARLVLDI
jgi:ferredoxin-NADP reductase